jgi:hypothetical protein
VAQNNDGTYIYTPDASYVGTDTITFKANDGVADSSTATITIHVTQFAVLNGDGSYSVLHDHTLANIDFSANDNDANGDPTQIDIFTNPSHGSLTHNLDGSYNYIPDAHYVGDDTVTIVANGGGTGGAWATVDVTIHVTDIAPVAKHTNVYLEAYNQVYSDIAFLADGTDADGDTLTVDIVSGPQHGSLNFNSSTGLYDYTATTSYLGRDNFSVRYYDGAEYSQTINVDILVYDDTTNFATDSYVQGFADLPTADFNGLPSGMGIHQGQIKDCWFVAAEVGLAQTYPVSFAARQGANHTPIIVDNGGSSYTVTFPGKNPVTFLYTPGVIYTNPADANKPFSFATSDNNNGDWMGILEKAWVWVNAPAESYEDGISHVLNLGQPVSIGITALTGRPTRYQTFDVTTNAQIRQDLQAAIAVGNIVTASTTAQAHGLEAPHAYTVLDFNAGADTVLLRNPWGYNKPWQEGTIMRPGLGGGAADFWLPLTDFTWWFNGAAYEQ